MVFRGLIVLLSLALCAGDLSAQQRQKHFTNAGFILYGGQLALVFSEFQDNAPALGLGGQADYEIFDIIHAVPSLEAWTSFHNNKKISGRRYTDWQSEISASLDVRCYFPIAIPTPVKPFAGGGLSMVYANFHHGDPDYLITSPANDHDFGLGLDFICGFDVPLAGYVPFLQIKVKNGKNVLTKIAVGVNVPIKSSAGVPQS